MKLAVISPTGLLKKYSQQDYHMALAHLVISSPEYAEYYKRTQWQGVDTTIILDNSVIELGEPLSDRHLMEAIRKVGPDEFILPDHRQDPAKTYNAAERWQQNRKMLRDSGARYMAVPQWSYNKYLWEWFDSMQALWDFTDVVGVPKFLRENRIEALRMIEANNLHTIKEFHLLGTWGNPIEVKTIQAEFPWVRGVDSKIPVRLGQRGVQLHPTLGLVLEREALRSMELTHSSDPFPRVTHMNIQIMKEWCDGVYNSSSSEGSPSTLRTVSSEG